jgi:hypothetical protein
MQQRRRSWDEVNAKDGDERTADGDEKTADGDERTADGDESMEAATETGDAWIDGDTMVNNNSDKEGNSDADEVRANGAVRLLLRHGGTKQHLSRELARKGSLSTRHLRKFLSSFSARFEKQSSLRPGRKPIDLVSKNACAVFHMTWTLVDSSWRC